MSNLLLTLTTLAILGFSNLVNAQAPNWQWAMSAGGNSEDYGYSVATDASGNIFMTGWFASPTITFGSITLTKAGIGSSDIFIVKYDAGGNALWAKKAGGTSEDAAISVATDVSGNVFLTGYFYSDSISFGNTTLTNAGSDDIFIVKYDSSGNVLWAKSAGSTGSDEGGSVCKDASGNVFITGHFDSPTITFGTTILTNEGSSDVFIVKYDANGNLLWANRAGGTNWDYGSSVATDASGNVFITGCFYSDSIIFGTNTLNKADTGNSDIFIVKFDASGNVLWAKGVGGNSNECGFSLCTDSIGAIYIIGFFQSSNINFGNTTLTNAGVEDNFILKFDASGNEIWAISAGGIYGDGGYSICSDASGNLYITGWFQSPTITFGTITLTKPSISATDIFIVKYDASGNVLWAKSEGGNYTDLAFCIASDVSGNVILTGIFESLVISFGTTNLTNLGSWSADLFIAKLDGLTGLESIENTIGFSIYPNPAKDVLTICHAQLQIGKSVTISISDIAGKVIYNRTLVAAEMMEVNTKDFAAGVYLVQVQTSNFVDTRKVIVGR